MTNLKDKYKRINRNVDFQLIDDIVSFVKNNRKPEGLSMQDISKGIGQKNEKVRTYCIEYIVPGKYISIHKKGYPRIYPVVTNWMGHYLNLDFGTELAKTANFVLSFFRKNPETTDKDIQEAVALLEDSTSNGNPNVGAQEKLVKELWSRGLRQLNCATFRRSKYLVQ